MPTPPEEVKVSEASVTSPTNPPAVPGTTETKVLVETKPAPFPAPAGSVQQKITITQSNRAQEFGRWGAGLLSGFIRGGAHAVASGSAVQIMTPVAMTEALTRYGVLFLCHGLISTALYLQTHPIPDEWHQEMAGTDKDRRVSERP